MSAPSSAAALDASRGNVETAMLRQTITDQLSRLLTQLEDLEELKDELEAGEYAEERADTEAQLREFQSFLDRSLAGDMSLLSEFGAAQLAVQAAISRAFKTPEVLRLFANKDADQLRRRLAGLDRDLKLRTLGAEAHARAALEVVLALKKMGETLTAAEEELLARTGATRVLETAAQDGEGAAVLSSASAGIHRAQQSN